MEEMLHTLMKENEQLRRENEKLLVIIRQMKITLNRLLNRYVMDADHASEK